MGRALFANDETAACWRSIGAELVSHLRAPGTRCPCRRIGPQARDIQAVRPAVFASEIAAENAEGQTVDGVIN